MITLNNSKYSDDGNHFFPTGFTGDTGDARIDETCSQNPHSGNTCIKIKYTFSHEAGARCPVPCFQRIENPNAETLSAIDDVNNNRNMSKTFDNVNALMEDLNA
jgi:hypothetical protein